MRLLLCALKLCALKLCSWGFVLLLAALVPSAGAQTIAIGPQAAPDGPARMQLHWIWSVVDGQQKQQVLQLRSCRPPGEAPAPVAVINHGSPAKASLRPTMKPSSCESEVAQWFLQRGYVVAFPLRRGYGETGGDWVENYGSCSRPNFHHAGLASADDIDAAVRYVTTLSYVQPGRTLVVGQSAGGWATIAYASRNPPGIAGLINFAGGRGGWAEDKPNTNCTPDALVEAAGRYGATARQPMLWVYTENDTFFAPALSKAMYDKFTAAGGKAQFTALGPWGKDGHSMFFGSNGPKTWGPVVEKYLAALPKP